MGCGLRSWFRCFTCVVCGLLSLTVAAEPVKVILDSDMLTDFDDVGALACLHAMADAGECEILATVSCTRGNSSVAAIEVINGYYGRPGIPVGCAKGMGVKGGSANGDEKSPLAEGSHGKYVKLAKDYAKWVKHPNSDDATDANEVYRRFKDNIPIAEIDKNPADFAQHAFGKAGRSAWDETAVLAAVRGDAGYFNYERGTYRMVGKDGDDEWIADANSGRHLRIVEKMSKAEVGKVIDELICRAPAAPLSPRQTEVMFFFDAEDFTSPRAWDAIRDLSNLFHEEGVMVHVALVGFLAEQLRKHKRDDVLAALKPHLVGTQSTYHSKHPNVMELSDGDDFAAAYARVMREEAEGIRWIERACGQRVLFAVPPGTSKSYVAMYVYADLGLKFYCDTVVDDGKAGELYGLNMRQYPYTVSMESLLPTPGETPKPVDWTAMLDQVAKLPRSILYLHPCMAVHTQFWDGLNYNCTNATEFGQWKIAAARPETDTQLYFARLRELIRRLKADPRFVFPTLAEKAARERPRTTMTLDDVPRLRAHFDRVGLHPLDNPSWCVADVFQATVAFLKGATTFVPGKAYGFLEQPYAIRTSVTLSAADLRKAARQLGGGGFLPSSIDVGGTKVGPGDFLRAALSALATGADRVTVAPSDPLATLNDMPVLRDFHPAGSWVFTPDYKDECTSDRLRWQCWTFRREEF